MTRDRAGLADRQVPRRCAAAAAACGLPSVVLALWSLRDEESGGFWAVFAIPLVVVAVTVMDGLLMRRLGVRLPFPGALGVALVYPLCVFLLGPLGAVATPGWLLVFALVGWAWASTVGAARPRERIGT